MSVLSDAEKASLVADFQTFGIDQWLRPLQIWQEAQQTVVVSNINFTPFNAYNQNSTQIVNAPVMSTVSGQILWDKPQEWDFVRPYTSRGTDEAQIKVKDQTTRACRLKIDPSGYNLLLNAKLVQIDGVQLVPQSQPRPHGLFWPTHYTFYYVRQM